MREICYADELKMMPRRLWTLVASKRGRQLGGKTHQHLPLIQHIAFKSRSFFGLNPARKPTLLNMLIPEGTDAAGDRDRRRRGG